MPIVRILLVLLALASPTLAQDGARDAAAARTAEQAFRVYVEGVTKKGGRPDLTRPEVAALLGRVFDLGALNALPPAQGERCSLANRLAGGGKRDQQTAHALRREAGAAA